jgi:phage FluMu gp28-like protein
MKSDLLDPKVKMNTFIDNPRNPDAAELAKLLSYITKESDFVTALLDQEEMNKNTRGDRDWEWELYQLAYLDVVGGFISNKPRQAGMSFACSAKYFATSQLTMRNFAAVFVSYKKEEAINKINYVKQILQALPPRFRKKIIRDPLQMIEWEDPGTKTRSKIYSHAQKPIRGVTADKILFDEFAFFNMPEIIYESAAPALIQTNGTIDVISTPFGKGGMFYDMLMDRRRFPDLTRFWIQWWSCRSYLEDPSIEGFLKAKEECPHLSTEERVMKFGSHRLRYQFRNALSLDSFQQEFEGLFIDESAAFFPKELIFSVMYDFSTDLNTDYAPKEDDFVDFSTGKILDPNSVLEDYSGKESGITEKLVRLNISRKQYVEIYELVYAAMTGQISKNLFAGLDVGAGQHSSILVIIEEIVFSDGTTFQIERFRKEYAKVPLPEQTKDFFNLLQTGIIRKFLMDATGLGQHMAQELKQSFPNTVEPWQMGGTAKKKEVLMLNLKRRMLDNTLALFYHKDTLDHIYSINRTVRGNKTVVYEADEDQRHHADIAWAIAFACYGGTKSGETPGKYSFAIEGSAESKFNDQRIQMSPKGLRELAEAQNPITPGSTGILQSAMEDSTRINNSSGVIGGLFNPGKLIKF